MRRFFNDEAHREAQAACEEELRRHGCPVKLIAGLVRYCIDHIETGQFLRKLLENDLIEAYRRADHENVSHIPAIIEALLMVAPSPAWGSAEKVAAWLKEGEELAAEMAREMGGEG